MMRKWVKGIGTEECGDKGEEWGELFSGKGKNCFLE
jgi:hypothetical protein